MSPVKYELGFYIPEDGVLHSNSRETPKSYTSVNVTAETTSQKLHPSTLETGRCV
jgi:hypothetical protein